MVLAKPNWKTRLWGLKGTILAYGLLLFVGATLAKKMFLEPREVTVASVTRGDVVAEVKGTGTVITKVLTKIGSKTNGRVKKVLVEEGEFVKEGQLLAILEDDDLRHLVDRARARLAAARASARQAKSAWKMAKKLPGTGALSDEAYDVYEQRYRVTKSEVGVEEADLRYHEFKLSELQVTTFVSGLVIRRWVEAGYAVVAGQSLISVADTSVIWVDARVDQRFSGNVRKDQPATVILRGRPEKPFPGRVYRVYPEADPVTEEMLVQASFALPTEELQVGQWAEVYVEVGAAKDAWIVPKAAVVPFANDQFVFVADPNGRARRVRIEPTATSPRLKILAVKADLKSGDKVILKPVGIKDGEKVRVTRTPSGP